MDLVANWQEYMLGLLALVVLIQWIIILRQSRQSKTELAPIIGEVRKELRKNHIAQKKLFGEIDYLLSEIPKYIQHKISNS